MQNKLLMATVFVSFGTFLNAATIRFDTDPFAGTTALTTPGRQVIGNELFLPNFSFTDVLSVEGTVFGVSGPLTFVSDLASNLPAGGATVIVLRSTDNDNNAATPFGAGNAANLIADAVTQSVPGFFVYHNSGLGRNRLVYSTDLSVNTADLKILARFDDPNGAGAPGALLNFAPGNFEVTQVPEPSTSLMMVMALLAGIGGKMHRRRSRPRV